MFFKIKKIRVRAILLALILALGLTAFCGCEEKNGDSKPTGQVSELCSATESAEGIGTVSVDYSHKESWAYYGEGAEKAADLFIICPTVDMGKSGGYNMSMDDEKTKASFVGALNMERGIYEEDAVLYAPYYRQMTFPAYSLSEEEMKPYLDLAYGDVADAFEYYMENLNGGRPLILAGFSQGSQLLLMLMEEYFDDSAYSNLLVAAYCIGWRITEEDVAKHPHLKMATGEKDTGVIVSFNSEAEGVEDSIVVPKGVKTLGINPLNWKTDGTPAGRELNDGACFTAYSGEIENEIPMLTGAYLDEERGTLRITDVAAEDYSSSLFPDGVYHLYDYQFFFRNLQENVGVRLESYLS